MVLPHCIGKGMSEQERDAFGYWLSGFADGEGCFQLQPRVKSSNHRTIICRASFGIDLRLDDIGILRKICSFLDCGTVGLNGTVNAAKARGMSDPKPQGIYRVGNIRDIANKLIPVFDRYPLRAKKARDYSIWKKGVELAVTVRDRVPTPKRGKGRGRGTLPKWLPEEMEYFIRLCNDLRQVRLYRDPDDPILDCASERSKPLVKKKPCGLFVSGKW